MSNGENAVSCTKLALAIRELRTKVDAGLLGCEPVAIIGIGCRFPGRVRSAADYWRLLCDGVDVVTEVPADRWDVSAYFDADVNAPAKMNGRWGAFLNDVDHFDPVFFGISPREAASMDPQQRLTLEVAWEALWDSGRAPEQISGTRTGVFMAIYKTDYSRLLHGDADGIGLHTCAGAAGSMASGRISYLLDLHGPSVSVDTACSSSLVTAHLAVQSLRTRDCDLALAGGVSLNLTPEHYLSLSKLSMLSPDGRCHTFDSGANGFVPGEGCGVVVLKRLSDAIADGDPIHAVIRGSAVNQDGRTNSLTAPNGLAQRAVVKAALANARTTPDSIGYVETHGTGTSLGDPIEVEALADVLGKGEEPCVLGAVKSNFGHLEAAAGVAGLIKAALVLKNGEIPANLHYRKLNPHISLKGTRLEVAQQHRQWKRGGRPRLAGVSSFGFTGTNAHLILEEPPQMPAPRAEQDAPGPYVLAVSARTAEALDAYVGRYDEFLRDATSPVADICRTAALRRVHYEERIAVTGSTNAELRERLIAAPRARVAGDVAPVAFVFSGQGSQWARMGVGLIATEPIFRAVIEEIDGLIRERAGWSLIGVLQADEAATLLNRTEYAQPAIFAVEVALAALWKSWGIVPAAVLGHSVGEIAAAHVAGVLDLTTAVTVALKRGRMMDAATGHGRMATVAQPAEGIALTADLSIAAVNGPASTVVSGDPAAVEALVKSWQARGIETKLLPVDYAFHSAQMDPFRTALPRELGDIATHEASIALISTVTGTEATTQDYAADYWGRNVRQPVLFQAAIESAVKQGVRCFLEIGPHAVLNTAIRECVAPRDIGVVSSLRRGRDERTAMMAAVAQFYTLGQDLNWTAVMGPSHKAAPLPAYPYQRLRHWIAPPPATKRQRDTAFAGERIVSPAFEGEVWQAQFDATHPAICDHRIAGTVVFPLAGYLELISSAVGGPVSIQDLEILEALQLGEATVQTVLKGEQFEIYSLGQQGAWRLHIRGTFSRGAETPGENIPRASGDSGEFYSRMNAAGLEYGPAYRTVQALDASSGEALAVIRAESFAALLDGCLQTFVAAYGQDGDLYMPIGLDRLELLRSNVKNARCRLSVRAGSTISDFVVVDDDGVIARGQGLKLKCIRGNRNTYELRWEARERVGNTRRGRYALAGNVSSIAAALERRGIELSNDGNVIVLVDPSWREVLKRMQDRSTAELWLVTRNAQRVSPSDTCDGLEQASVWGLARTAALEYPDLRYVRVDIDGSPESETSLVEEILAPGDECEIAFRKGERYTSSVRALPTASTDPVRLTVTARGSFDGLAYEPVVIREPARDEVEVKVITSALNFRDVMNALGAYPGDAGLVGLEFCGQVLRRGSDVKNCSPGDLVLGLGWGCFSDVFVAKSALLVVVPTGIDAESAVTLPNAFITAYHSLVTVARLKRGERVLIHAAAGGVGSMAVQLALKLGAEVFATAGSEDKRRYLRDMGVQHVYNSRTLDFARGVLEDTGGRGVDVVLNSLAGDFIAATFSVVAPGGRFVEIGKTGIWDAERVAALGRSIEYTVVDIGVFLDHNPDLITGYLTELGKLDVRPLPKRTFPFSQAKEAFRFMAQARHTGKIVLRHEDGGFRTKGAWLLTGGMGELGTELARWLAARGASKLVLVGRHAAQTIAIDGAAVECHCLDVADPEAVRALVQATGPFEGIVHLAGVLDDGVIQAQTWDRFQAVMRPKATGAWNLHEVAGDVAHFVMFSSAASLLGSPGQGNYAAANAYLDALAAYRVARNLPALSIQWGAWADVGMAARSDRRSMSCLQPMKPAECLEALGRVMDTGHCSVAILSADWQQWHAMPGRSRTEVAIGSRTRTNEPATPAPSIAATLAALPTGRRRKAAIDFVRLQASRILGLGDSYPIADEEPLIRLGLDSLMALELRNTLAQAFGRPLSATLLFDHPTTAALADYLAPAKAVAPAEAEDRRDLLFEEISAMSDEEAEQLLAQELSSGSGS